MYFKSPTPPSNQNIRIPIGYRGNAFSTSQRQKSVTPTQKPRVDNNNEANTFESKKFDMPQKEAQKKECEEKNCELCPILPDNEIKEEIIEEKNRKSLSSGLLGLDDGLDAEELLILALALIVFQGGKENELALLLLALLFIK